MKCTRNRAWILTVACCLLSVAVQGIMVYRESWDSSACGWSNRFSGPMVMHFSSTNSADNGCLAGVLGDLDYPKPQFDVFRAGSESSGGLFVGDYLATDGQIPYSLSFDFVPCDVLPSSFIFRCCGSKSGVTNTFFTSLADQLTSSGMWHRITVSLQYNSNTWIGGSAADFSNLLSNVEWIEVQVGRSGTIPQTYVMDHFARVDWVPQGSGDDMDGDHLPDYWEEAYFDGPTSGMAGDDLDGDGYDNEEEYIAGTHPGNRESYPSLGVEMVHDSVSLLFLSSVGRLYALERASNLLAGNWVIVADSLSGDGGYISLTDTNSPGIGVYRFRVWVPSP